MLYLNGLVSSVPLNNDGTPIRGTVDLMNGRPAKIDHRLKLHRAMARSHEMTLQKVYGRKPKKFTPEEIEKRARADDGDDDSKDVKDPSDGSCLYESLEEQCQARGIDVETVLKREQAYFETREAKIRSGIQVRGLDGGTDTALVGVDYMHEWLRVLRLSGRLVSQFTQQIDLQAGAPSLVGPVVGDAQFLKVGAVTTNTYSVNPAVNPTSTTVTWTPQKSFAVIFISKELTEDSLVPIIENLKVSFMRGAAIAQEHQLISGDTVTTTANINSYADNGSNSGLGDQDPRLSFDGLRAMDYKGTVGKSAGAFSGVDGSNAIATIDAVSGTLQKMGKYGEDPSRVLTIAPVQIEKQLLKDAKARPFAYGPVFQGADGRVLQLSGSRPVFLGNSSIDNTSDGHIPTYAAFQDDGYPTNLDANGRWSGSSGVRTGFVCVREDNILFVWKRVMVISLVDLGLSDQLALVASYRWIPKQKIVGLGVKCSYNFAA